MAKFDDVSLPIGKTSKHSLSNKWVGSLQWGQLTPIYCKYVMPGERVEYNPSILIQSPAFSVVTFGRMKVHQHSFFVPARLLWKDFQSFILGGDDGRQVWTPPYTALLNLTGLCGCEINETDNIKLVPRSTAVSDWNAAMNDWYSTHNNNTPFNRGRYSSLILGMGLNVVKPFEADARVYTNSYGRKKIGLLPFRAYQKCWWDWYRDSTLVPESLKNQYLFTNGGNQGGFLEGTSAEGVMNSQFRKELETRRIAYDKDYFTTARTSPQSGTPSLVPVDMGGSSTGLEVYADGKAHFIDTYPLFSYMDNNRLSDGGKLALVQPETVGSNTVFSSLMPPGVGTGRINNMSGDIMFNHADNDTLTLTPRSGGSSSLASFSVETFRVSNALQRFLERSNVTGTRPLAQLLGRFGVAPSAARLDMAEFIGGEDRWLDPIQVISTARTEQGELADRAAYGKLHYNGGKQTYYAKEHGYFISLLSITPEVDYCDGIDRMFSMETKEDFFLHEYENLGYDAIPYSEMVSMLTYDSSVNPDDSFGFQPRYSWLKWKRSVLAGDFARTSTDRTSDMWHTFRRFNLKPTDNLPALNSGFVEVAANDGYNNWNRLFDNTTNVYDPFEVNVYNECICTLPMEGFAEPALSNVYEMDGKRVTIPYGGMRL